jgi:signal transduction histidine kinase
VDSPKVVSYYRARAEVAVNTGLDFQLLFEASPEILLVLLPDPPRFTMVAATGARLAATNTTRETLGRGLFEVFPDNPDDPGATGTSNLRASLERVVATLEPDTMAVQKYDIRGPDGSFQVKYWSPKNIPVLSPQGELRFILHRVEDVTELVEASELGQQLQDHTREMELEVLARSRELDAANRKLREANARLGELDRAKTAFFGNVSHEFRTPLTLISSPVEQALHSPEGTLSRDELESVHRNALRLLRLVNRLLDFARVESGQQSSMFAPVDLARITSGLVGAFQSLFEEAGVRLVSDCPPLPEPVYVDATQWEHVVMNLVSNAFKFTFEGEVFVGLRWCGDHVELLVRDTGTGIPEAELPRVFERFHRVTGAHGRSFEGTGIGLALVHELVRLHGGSVRVTSVLGQGSTFVVSIPTGSAHLPKARVAAAVQTATTDEARLAAHVLEAKRWLRSSSEARASMPARPSTWPPSQGERPGRLLVAEDNADMRDYLRSLLAPHWETQLVPNGKAALDAALDSPPDLVLSDVMMPEMDGVALLQALRADPRTSTVPVILISARAGDEARLLGLETGADDYLVKPFAAREVLTRVRTHLEMARARKASGEAARALSETRASLMADLEQKHVALGSAYAELRETQSQLVQSAKMASLGELVAGIAHELNNPLSFALGHIHTISGALGKLKPGGDALAEGDVESTWQRATDRARELRGGLERISDLVRRLRTFSRLDEGELKHVSVRESVESVLTILRHRLSDHISLVVELGEPDEIECYASLFNQAAMNLLTNAVDAVDGAGHVTLTTGARDGWFELVVSDDGPGIPEAIRERVLEPFFTTKPVGSGTGLGLSITHSIAQRHGGVVELCPREGGGTVASLRFPLQAPGTT